MKEVISVLGEITPDRPVVINMLCYTINLSPKYMFHGTAWGDKSPVEQYRVLRRVHRTMYLRIYKYLSTDEEITNEVAFEFTKAGELHSHGYFILDKKYGGYERYKYMLLKFARAAMMLPNWNNNAIFIRYANDNESWINYLNKDLSVSGFEKYRADIESETTILTILDYLNYPAKPHSEERNTEKCQENSCSEID